MGGGAVAQISILIIKKRLFFLVSFPLHKHNFKEQKKKVKTKRRHDQKEVLLSFMLLSPSKRKKEINHSLFSLFFPCTFSLKNATNNPPIHIGSHFFQCKAHQREIQENPLHCKLLHCNSAKCERLVDSSLYL